MTRDTVFAVLAYAQECKNEFMVDACLQFLASDFSWLLMQDEFRKLSFEHMIGLFEKANKSENAIDCFNAIKIWHQFQGESEKKDGDINSLVGLVDWSSVSESNFVDVLTDLDDRTMR